MHADGFGAWDSHNCRVLNETAEEVECGCDHLTHFAILLVSIYYLQKVSGKTIYTFSSVPSFCLFLQDINPKPPPPSAGDAVLTGVSYIGTVLSIICLTITIVTYLGEQ